MIPKSYRPDLCGSLMILPSTYFDISIHYISLAAIILVLGMLVDDSIIIAENIYRYREKGLDPKKAAIKGVQEVAWPVVTTVLTTIIVFLPILGMSGSMLDPVRQNV